MRSAILLPIVALLLVPPFAWAEEEPVALSKDVSVMGDRVRIVLKLENKGSLEVRDIELHEYYNPDFYPDSPVFITYDGKNYTYPIFSHEEKALTTKIAYFILMPPIQALKPGESMTFEYYLRPSKEGSYLMPNSVVWYSYGGVRGSVRKYACSDSKFISIPTRFEREFVLVYPYILSTAVAITVFYGLRSIASCLKRSYSRSR